MTRLLPPDYSRRNYRLNWIILLLALPVTVNALVSLWRFWNGG